MKAMILAAGLGTRLKPLTDNLPKALIEIGKTPLLELVIKKLNSVGVTEIIINVHHRAEQIIAFLQSKNNFNLHLEISLEQKILGTGGGLLKAANFFDDERPFFIHNVDILSNINLADMYAFHLERKALATLAVQSRKSSRYFVVDEKNFLCGHEDISQKLIRMKRIPNGKTQRRAFCGIHVISPKLFEAVIESGNFSIVDLYLKLVEKGMDIIAYPADQNYWQDIGKINTLKKLENDLATGKIFIENFTH